MPGKKSSSPRRVRLFQSDWLERLTLISPQAFALTWLAILAVVVCASWGRASLPASIGLVSLGLLIWTLFEYAMHRFVFHLKMQSEFGRRLMHLTHGNHHDAPSDPYRNIMPPLVSLAIVGSFWLLFVLVIGAVGSVLFLGFAIGYVIYDSVHYACHQLPMRGRLWSAVRQHHNRHHFVDQDGNYAITAIFWDRVFGTFVPVRRR